MDNDILRTILDRLDGLTEGRDESRKRFDEMDERFGKRFDFVDASLETLAKHLALTNNALDAHRRETTSHRQETLMGFERVERRLGNVETRVESIETELQDFRGEFERRIAPLER